MFDFIEEQMEDHSSTKVREELMKGNSVESLCGIEVYHYLQHNGLYDFVHDWVSTQTVAQ